MKTYTRTQYFDKCTREGMGRAEACEETSRYFGDSEHEAYVQQLMVVHGMSRSNAEAGATDAGLQS